MEDFETQEMNHPPICSECEVEIDVNSNKDLCFDCWSEPTVGITMTSCTGQCDVCGDYEYNLYSAEGLVNVCYMCALHAREREIKYGLYASPSPSQLTFDF